MARAALLADVMVAFLTTLHHALKAARANPVDSMKYE